MDGPNVNWKTVEIIKEYWEQDDPGGSDLIEIGSCGLHVLHGAYGTAQKATDWKLLKAIYLIFKLSPAWREDYLKVNELLESHESKSVAYLFPQKFCGHRWLKNETPPKDDAFTIILDKMGFPVHLATLQFSLFICNEI